MQHDHSQLLKNIQKVNLNAWEIASALKKMMVDLKLTQDEIAKMAGKKRSTVANYLRLFQLPNEIQGHVKSGKITMGHAKAILALPRESQVPFCKEILSKKWSVRKTELASKSKEGGEIFLKEIKNSLEAHLGTKVAVTDNRIVIDYYSLDDLERVLEVIGCK